jgi:hypothetical protein
MAGTLASLHACRLRARRYVNEDAIRREEQARAEEQLRKQVGTQFSVALAPVCSNALAMPEALVGRG